ncbi:MAG: segregation and condensation protein A [Betaproteobacteria bacterium]|nr:segregation and condensation protein A [Betaproteobacteria bacterium]
MPTTPQNSDLQQNMEQRILRVMRKVLAKIVREVAPRPGTASPLSDDTIEDIRECFNLISIREKELAEAQNITPQKPFYSDQPPSAKLVKISRTVTRKKGKDDSAK